MILYKTTFVVETTHLSTVHEALEALRAAALQIPGCRGFQTLEEPYKPEVLTVVEEWADAVSVKTHEDSEAVAVFWQLTGHLIEQQGPTNIIEVGGPQTLYVTPSSDDGSARG